MVAVREVTADEAEAKRHFAPGAGDEYVCHKKDPPSLCAPCGAYVSDPILTRGLRGLDARRCPAPCRAGPPRRNRLGRQPSPGFTRVFRTVVLDKNGAAEIAALLLEELAQDLGAVVGIERRRGLRGLVRTQPGWTQIMLSFGFSRNLLRRIMVPMLSAAFAMP